MKMGTLTLFFECSSRCFYGCYLILLYPFLIALSAVDLLHGAGEQIFEVGRGKRRQLFW
jgi:hypothetical protein